MKKQPSIFCFALALMTFATLLIGARSEPANTNIEANPASALIQQKATEEAKAVAASDNPYSPALYTPPSPAVTYTYAYPTYVNTYPAYVYPSYYSYPRYCYSSPFYYRYGYSGYQHC